MALRQIVKGVCLDPDKIVGVTLSTESLRPNGYNEMGRFHWLEVRVLLMGTDPLVWTYEVSNGSDAEGKPLNPDKNALKEAEEFAKTLLEIIASF